MLYLVFFVVRGCVFGVCGFFFGGLWCFWCVVKWKVEKSRGSRRGKSLVLHGVRKEESNQTKII